MTALDVFLHSDRVGRLERMEGARLRFAYDPSWQDETGTPLSLGLPLRGGEFDDEECRPFFAGLLPEGGFLRAIAQAFHVSPANPFSVLTEIGGECAGAVSLAPPGAQPAFASARPPTWLAEPELGKLLAELPGRPLLIGIDDEDEGLRLSLAGAQDKLPVLVEGDRVGITRGRPPSTHIVKVPVPGLDGIVANEAFCMALASQAGLDAAEATPIRAGGCEALLVSRYDRIPVEGGVHRVHQEDLCQALGYLPEEKYEADGGPGIEACATFLRENAAAPAVDLLAFLDAIAFNLLIGNADAHSKNYSLLLEGGRAPRLGPLYDLISTRVYGRRFGRKMAMRYGGEYRFDRIRARHLDRLGADFGISAKPMRRRIEEMVDRVLVSCTRARGALPDAWQDNIAIDRIEAVIGDAAERLLAALAEPG